MNILLQTPAPQKLRPSFCLFLVCFGSCCGMALPIIVRSVTSVPSSSIHRFVIHSLSKPMPSVPSLCLHFIRNAFFFPPTFKDSSELLTCVKNFLHHHHRRGKRPVDEGELIFPPHSRQLSDYFSWVGWGFFLILTWTNGFWPIQKSILLNKKSQGWRDSSKKIKREKKGLTCRIGFQLVDSHQ